MSLLDKQEVQDICGYTALRARKWSGFICKRASEDTTLSRYAEERRMKNAKWRFFTSRGHGSRCRSGFRGELWGLPPFAEKFICFLHDLSQFPTLKNRRLYLKLCTLYKIMHGYFYFPLNVFLPQVNRHSYSLPLVHIPHARTNAFKSSFVPSTVSIWNCHGNFGPGNFGPGDQNFQWKIGPAGPIFLEKWSASGKLVRIISALVTSDCCG